MMPSLSSSMHNEICTESIMDLHRREKKLRSGQPKDSGDFCLHKNVSEMFLLETDKRNTDHLPNIWNALFRSEVLKSCIDGAEDLGKIRTSESIANQQNSSKKFYQAPNLEEGLGLVRFQTHSCGWDRADYQKVQKTSLYRNGTNWEAAPNGCTARFLWHQSLSSRKLPAIWRTPLEASEAFPLIAS